MPYHPAGQKSFFVRDNGATAGTTFELHNTATGKTWTRTYTGDLTAGEAVLITGPDGTGDDGWTEITVSTGILTAANFPDANFRAYVTAQMTGSSAWDANGDGILSEAEAATVRNINVNSEDIASLAGIEYFTGLTDLSCGGNPLSALDVSANTELTRIEGGYHRCLITSLDLAQSRAAIDAVIASLPARTGGTPGKIRFMGIDYSSAYYSFGSPPYYSNAIANINAYLSA